MIEGRLFIACRSSQSHRRMDQKGSSSPAEPTISGLMALNTNLNIADKFV